MSGGGANYRDEARLEHMMRAAGRIRAQLAVFSEPLLELFKEGI